MDRTTRECAQVPSANSSDDGRVNGSPPAAPIRRSGWICVVLAVLALSTTACDQASDLPPALNLPEHGNFQLTFQAACIDGPCEGFDGLYSVVYRDGTAVAATAETPDRRRAALLTREELALLPTPTELVAGATEDADYDPTSGLPSRAVRGAASFDDIGLELDLEAAAAALESARATWEATGITDYRLSYFRNCFCLTFGEVVVEVADGRPTPIEIGDLEDPSAAADRVPLTVEALHDAIGRLLAREPHIIEVTYGPEGHPTRIAYDGSVSTVDDESSYSGITVEPLP